MLREKTAMKCQCHNTLAKTLLTDIFSRRVPIAGRGTAGRNFLRVNRTAVVPYAEVLAAGKQVITSNTVTARRDEKMGPKGFNFQPGVVALSSEVMKQDGRRVPSCSDG